MAAVLVSAGWYLAVVELGPAGARPYIGGSQSSGNWVLARDWLPWLRYVVLVLGLSASALLIVADRMRGGRGIAVLAVVASLSGAGACTGATAATPHSGAIPAAGPAVSLLRKDSGAYTWAAATAGSNPASPSSKNTYTIAESTISSGPVR